VIESCIVSALSMLLERIRQEREAMGREQVDKRVAGLHSEIYVCMQRRSILWATNPTCKRVMDKMCNIQIYH